MMHYIKMTEDKGRGLFAAYDIQQNKILFTAELLVFNAEDTVKVNETDLKWYTFKYSDTQDCLVLGDGEIFNHDNVPNVGYKLMDYGDGSRKVMVFYALRDIEANEELSIDYGADVAVDATQYQTNMI